MKHFLIYYNYDIKDLDKDLVVLAEHRTMEVEAESRSKIDTDMIREKIRYVAHEARPHSNCEVIHANYYKIEEIKD